MSRTVRELSFQPVKVVEGVFTVPVTFLITHMSDFLALPALREAFLGLGQDI